MPFGPATFFALGAFWLEKSSSRIDFCIKPDIQQRVVLILQLPRTLPADMLVSDDLFLLDSPSAKARHCMDFFLKPVLRFSLFSRPLAANDTAPYQVPRSHSSLGRLRRLHNLSRAGFHPTEKREGGACAQPKTFCHSQAPEAAPIPLWNTRGIFCGTS